MSSEPHTSSPQCIHRTGCHKPKVCAKVGHCTSMTVDDLAARAIEKASAANQMGGCFCHEWHGDNPRCPTHKHRPDPFSE